MKSILNLSLFCIGILFGFLYPISASAALIVKAEIDDKQVTLKWASVQKATGYGLCYATEAIFDINNCINYSGGTWKDIKKNTVKITRLMNDKIYFFRVLAKNDNGTLTVSDMVKARPNKLSTLNDTGINNSQCFKVNYGDIYSEIADLLVSCDSKAAKNLNKHQDGMEGRDVTTNDYNDGYAGFSFTKIGSDGKALPANAHSWSCVKDNVTGLLWENKTADGGLHDGDNLYSNTLANLGSEDEAISFVMAVSQQTLCGRRTWRLPRLDELQGIVNYSIAFPGPTIDNVYFANTPENSIYWSSSECNVFADCAWFVSFSSGSTGYEVSVDRKESTFAKHSVRLVSDSH